ncbi:hypothetical protein RSAG8_12312, partial [Rhizoctonia solani AG-8 WAC10335]
MSRHLRNRSFSDDPFAVMTRPPPNESAEAKQRRQSEEQMAKQRSELIDEEIKRDRQARQQAEATQRKLLLLVGQAESGKTTTLKQFQLLQSESAFNAQLHSYRALIYLNVLNSLVFAFFSVFLRPTSLSTSSRGPCYPTPPLASHPKVVYEVICMDWNSRDDPGRIFADCVDYLIALWEDEAVQTALAKQRPSIRESPGFFMDDLARVAARGYMPSADDILRARIKTLGVQEHRVRFDRGPDKGLEWIIFDVGGARSQRLRWAPYFQTVNAIIFLAPISPFNQTLAEDPRMNRVKDSLLLWQEICKNKVLKKVSIVLFLNKCDLLKAKLASGVQFKKYMTSYKGPNEWAPVAEFLRSKFDDVYQANTPSKRSLYVHQTSVVDSRTTQRIIQDVREQIMKDALAAVGLY